MKTNSQITIWIFATILIFWISFLFIEQWNKTNNSEKIQITSTQKEQIKTQKDLLKQEKIKAEQEKKEKLSIKLKQETQKIADENKQKQIEEENTKAKQKQEEINKPIIIPQKYDIQNMQFFSQAPYGNWNQPYQDACEEASLLIGYYYIKNMNKTKDQYNKDLLKMVKLEMDMLWYFESTTIMEMKQIINTRDPSIKAKIIEHPSIRDIEKEISQNHAVIAPFYGKWINNPHYASWWPEYHFMVIKWYDQSNFITHDVWTIRWANRNYPKSLLMEHMHDWNRIDVQKWAPRILVLEK